jgi:hypothetical protein
MLFQLHARLATAHQHHASPSAAAHAVHVHAVHAVAQPGAHVALNQPPMLLATN